MCTMTRMYWGGGRELGLVGFRGGYFSPVPCGVEGHFSKESEFMKLINQLYR